MPEPTDLTLIESDREFRNFRDAIQDAHAQAATARSEARAARDDAEQTALNVSELGAIDGTVSAESDLPSASAHDSEFWYVVQEKAYYTSNGSSWGVEYDPRDQWVDNVENITELRNRSTETLTAVHVLAPTENAGLFLPFDNDPLGDGDDGVDVLASSNGEWWGRESKVAGLDAGHLSRGAVPSKQLNIAPDGLRVSTVPTVSPNGGANVSPYTTPITTKFGEQYVGYWDKGVGVGGTKAYLTLAQRTLPRGEWNVYRYDGTGGRPTITSITESHHTIALGVDDDGVIHVAYGMHNDPLEYRRSTSSGFVGGLTSAQSMTGNNENSVSYPQFVRDSDGELYFLYRNGSQAGNTEVFINKWDNGAKTWSQTKIFEDQDTSGKNRSAYWGVPRFDDQDNLYIPYCWRTGGNVDENKNIGLLVKRGSSFEAINGDSISLPIEEGDSADQTARVATIPEGDGLLNQSTAVDIDGDGHPLITHQKYDPNGHVQVYAHYWNNGWAETKITDEGQITDLGNGAEFERPKAAIDRENGYYYVLYRHAGQEGLQIASTDDPTDGDWNRSLLIQQKISKAAPLYDRDLWVNSRVLSLWHANPRKGSGPFGWGLKKPDLDGFIIDVDPAREFSPAKLKNVQAFRNQEAPFFKLTLSSDWSMTGTLTKIPFDNVNWRDGANYDTGAAEYTVPHRGLYKIELQFAVESPPDGTAIKMEIQANGNRRLHHEEGATLGFESFQFVGTLDLKEGDTVTLLAAQDSGSSLNVRSDPKFTRAEIRQVTLT